MPASESAAAAEATTATPASESAPPSAAPAPALPRPASPSEPLPDDFDPLFFNAAPSDQQPAALRDDQPLVLENLLGAAHIPLTVLVGGTAEQGAGVAVINRGMNLGVAFALGIPAGMRLGLGASPLAVVRRLRGRDADA